MASILYHHNKKNGDIYVYSSESYWDKEKKAPRTRQTYLGKLNQETGEIIPAKRRMARKPKSTGTIEASTGNTGGATKLIVEPTASVKVAGPAMILEKAVEDVGLKPLLKSCFPAVYQQILSLVFFIVQKGLPLSRSESWSSWNLHPSHEVIVSQRVSDLLQDISEDQRQNFLARWLTKISENDYLCYDLTSISSYAKANEYLKRGYNRDRESLPQLNLAMLFGQNSGLPAYYRRMPGNISDVSTLKTTLKSFDFLGAGQGLHLVLDRGFYSQSNIDELLKRRHHFTLAVPAGRKWVEQIMDRHYESIADPQYFLKMEGKEVLYAVTELHKWGPDCRRTYLHIYYNAQRAAADFDNFSAKLLQYREELKTGRLVAAHDEFYKRFFIINETPRRGRKIEFNKSEIQKYRKRYAGFFCLMSNTIKDPMAALNIYRDKDCVENCFDDLKNQLDMKRLRVHSSRSMDSRIFLQFLALILISHIRKTIKPDNNLKGLSVRDIMEAMEPLVKINYSGRYGALYSETNPRQRNIMEAFNLSLNS